MIPLSHSKFQLDFSGVAGFFGGEETVAAMSTMHMYPRSVWQGWYNSPGSYNIAKKYGQIANSGFWDGLFPGANVEPATLFGLDGNVGPKFIGVHSGTTLNDTGHTGSLFLKHCESLQPVEVDGRESSPASVTIADLKTIPPIKSHPSRQRSGRSVLALIATAFSLCGCALCGRYQDWYCFSMILLGIVANGLSWVAIGSLDLMYTHPKAAGGSPPGDGIMNDGKAAIVLLRGKEQAVNSVTRGRFLLLSGHEHDSDCRPNNGPQQPPNLNSNSNPNLDAEHGEKPKKQSSPSSDTSSEYRRIGLCSILLLVQFLAQLLLIPQGTLFGQIMFLSTLAISWAYNSFLSSLDSEKIESDLLVTEVLKDPQRKRFKFGTWTSTTVFTLLAAQSPEPETLLHSLIPNHTVVWTRWKAWVLENIKPTIPRAQAPLFDVKNPYLNFEDLDSEQEKLLKNLVQDAKSAYIGFQNNRRDLELLGITAMLPNAG